MIIKNADVITPTQILHETDVEIKDGHIIQIKKEIDGTPKIDAKGMYLAPGLIDIHTHGGYGGDFMDNSDESFSSALRFHTENGTTAVLASTATAGVEKIVSTINRIRRFMQSELKHCRVLGCNIEGPYISYKNKGAQNAEHLRVPSKDDYSFIIEHSDVIKNVTISPELDGAEKMVQELNHCGIMVSGGHDDALSEDIYPLLDKGMKNCTHWYCAMSTAKVVNGKRSVGLMEIGLLDERLNLELLADNHHLPPELVKLAYRMKGADKLCLVSDSLRCAGMPADGRVYTLGAENDEYGTKFVVADGVARLIDGTRFAGSIQPVRQMVKNLVFDCDIPLCDAVRMASLTPAKLLGVSDELGSVEQGKKADLLLMDENLNVIKTIIDGNVVFNREEQ